MRDWPKIAACVVIAIAVGVFVWALFGIAGEMRERQSVGDLPGSLRPRVLEDVHTMALTAEEVQKVLRGERRIKLTHQTWIEVVE